MADQENFMVQLTRANSSVSWGFRLQGGADFSTPLSIQLVQPGSVAEQSGLQAGDGVLQINNAATETLEHEAAKMEIIRAGNEVQFLIQRGAVTTWRPKITPMSELKPSELQTHTLPGEAPPMQRTSLAANQQPVHHIGSSHNRSARPFGASASPQPESHISIRDSFPEAASAAGSNRNQLQQEYLNECGGQTTDVDYSIPQSQRGQPAGQGPTPGIVHAQYNTPMGIYSNKNVNNSFNQQASAMKDEFGNMSLHDDREVTATTAQNNNNVPKSTSTTYLQPAQQQSRAKSPTLQALEQDDQAEPKLYNGGKIQSRSFKMLENELEGDEGQARPSVFSGHNGSNSLGGVPGLRSVSAPKNNMKMTGPRFKQPTTKCYVCGNFITGIFVRVKEHCLHSECLKCAQCGRNLKNIGYISVGDKIYCVSCAKALTHADRDQ